MTYSNDKNYAVLGRGIAGLSAAYHLQKAGLRTVVFGKREGASRAAQGVLCNKGLVFAESPLFRAKLASLGEMKSFLDQLEKESGLPIPREFRGVEEPIWSEDDFRTTVTRVYRHNFWGVYGTLLRTHAQRPLESTKTPLTSLHYPQDGWFDPRALLDALESFLRTKGTEFVDEEIESFGSEDSFVRIGTRRFDHLILATGAGSEKLWSMIDCKVLRMFLIGGQTLEVSRTSEASKTQILVKGNHSIALLKDRAILGSSSWLGFESEDIELDRRELLKDVEEEFGVKFDGGLSRKGTRLRFKDRMPLVGWLNTGRFAGKIYFLTGFYRNGMHLGELCAREMLCDIIGKSEDRRYPEFSALRFSV